MKRQVPRPVEGTYSASPSQIAVEMTLVLPERCVTTHGLTVSSRYPHLASLQVVTHK